MRRFEGNPYVVRMAVYGHVNTGRAHGAENTQDRFGIITFQKLVLQFVHRFRHGNTQPHVVVRDIVIPVEREDRFFAVRFDISVIQNSARYEVGYRDWETDRKSTRLNSSHSGESRMPSSA